MRFVCVHTLQKHLVVRRAATSTQSLSLFPHTHTHTHKEAAARRGNSLVGKTKDHSQLDLVISNKDITDCARVCVCSVCECTLVFLHVTYLEPIQ